MPGICNSSPLIALTQIDRLDLLSQLHPRVVIPPTVAREVRRTIPVLPHWLAVQELKRPMQPFPASRSIGPGEHEAISLGLELSAERLILDEQPARRLAIAVGLRVIGTVGLLLEAKERGLLGGVKTELDRLIAARFFMDDKLYKRIIAQAGE